MTGRRVLLALVCALGGAAALVGCSARTAPAGLGDAQPSGGHGLSEAYGCGACHSIPGVDGANGRVGPSLAGIRSRWTIAGRLPNTPANLARWIADPKRIDPGTLMPNLGVSPAEARDIAAYLETR